MQRKILWSILIFVCILEIVVVIFCNKYISQFSHDEFSDFVAQKRTNPQKNEEVSLIAVGDISYSRGVERIVQSQKDINYPFQKIQDYLKTGDIVFGNLETPITAGRAIADMEMVFRSNPGTEKALHNAGFSIVSLSNNHTMNFGEKGIEDTFTYLNTAGITYVGAGKDKKEANQPIYMTRNGITFAFLTYGSPTLVPSSYEAGKNHAGIAFMNIENMKNAIKEAKKKADIVIVSMHAGTEYVQYSTNEQKQFAHGAIDAGADMVIGQHPHVVQTMEKYKGKYIFYNLGNFVFDQMWSQETREGLIIKVYFTKKGVTKISLLPVIIENYSQPRIANNAESKSILQRLDFPLDNDVIYSLDSSDNATKSTKAVVYDQKPMNNILIEKKAKADLNKNNVLETYTLQNGKLSVTEKGKLLWQSPSEWWVDNFVLADSNNDGTVDINLSVWKRGDFGSSKPFWIKQNDMSIKNHFFIFDLVNNNIKPIWQSSNLDAPNCEYTFADIDGDGKNDLLVIEGDYATKPVCNGQYVAVWKWNGWGFSNEWRSEKGNFSNLMIEQMNGKNNIVVDTF